MASTAMDTDMVTAMTTNTAEDTYCWISMVMTTALSTAIATVMATYTYGYDHGYGYSHGQGYSYGHWQIYVLSTTYFFTKLIIYQIIN